MGETIVSVLKPIKRFRDDIRNWSCELKAEDEEGLELLIGLSQIPCAKKFRNGDKFERWSFIPLVGSIFGQEEMEH